MRPRTSHNLRGPACSLCEVIQFGYFHQISLLVSKGIDAEVRDALGRTPLILCAFMQPQEWGVGAAMTLVEHGVYLGEKDCFGRNVLHYACIYERQNLLRVLLRAIDFDLNQADALGNTPLHYAAMSGNVSITKLLVQSFRKYRIKADKVNRQGRTALAEAMASGNAACARVIEMELNPDEPRNTIKDVHFTDDVAVGSHVDNSTTRNIPALDHGNLPRSTSAAIAGRRESSSPINSAREGRSLLCSVRSSVNVRSGRARKSSNPLYANGYRRDEDIICCAPDGDFRNTPDYVCKLVRLPADVNFWGHVTDLTNGNNAGEDTSSVCQKQQSGSGWRRELRQLFQVYEHQCSASWRTSKQVDQPGAAPPTSTAGTEDEDKGKKGRNCVSAIRAAHWKESSPEPRKRLASIRSRKLANGKHPGGPTADGSLDTSSESINSLVSVKRKGLEKDSSLGRPESSIAKHRVKSARGRNSQTQSPITFMASSPLPTSTTSKTNPRAGNTAAQTVNTKDNPTPSSNNTTNHGATTSVFLPALSAVSSPSPVPAHQVTTADTTSSASRQDRHQLASPHSAGRHDAAGSLPQITVVRETHAAQDRHSSGSSSKPQQQVDTNKLWVQNPYDSNNNEAEERTDNIN